MLGSEPRRAPLDSSVGVAGKPSKIAPETISRVLRMRLIRQPERGPGLRGGESLAKFRVAGVASSFFLLSLSVILLSSPLASAASVMWTTDADFNGPDAVFTGTELIGTGAAARVDLLKDVIDWRNENPGTGPGALDGPAAAFDPTGNVTVLFGGNKVGNPGMSNKTWEYSHVSNTWTEITTTPKPPGRQLAGLSYDPGQRVMVLFGGYDENGNPLADTWEYSVSTNTWAQISPPTSPPPLWDSPLVYHASAQKHIVFGQSSITNDMQTWAYDAAADTWTNRNPSGSPSTRSGFAMAYSQARARTVLFGGALLMTVFDQTFEYNYAGNSWSQISVTGPAARAGHSMTYRPASLSVLLFGGATSSGNSQETWRYFNLTGGPPTWLQVTTASKPPARTSAALAYDTKDDVAVLYGGISSDGSRLGDTWTLGAAYRSAGKYTSPVKDAGGFPTWGTLWWNKTPANQPANTFLRFRVATSTSVNGPWAFSGPNGSPSTNYSTPGTTLWS